MKKNNKMSSIFMSILFLVGIMLVLFPFVSDGINNYLNNQIIQNYQAEANKKNEKELKEVNKKWKDENQRLQKEVNNQTIGQDPFSIQKKKVKPEKDYFENRTIAYLDIPKIKIQVPIFNGTNELLLEKGAGLLEGTSYPIGGLGTHSVISAHRGLETAKLFTDLPQLEKGDLFVVTILNEKHAYEVDAISIIEPDDIEQLRIIPGKDYITLLTCTPFMINSHRLLVRGHRVPYTKNSRKEIKKSEGNRKWNQCLLVFLCIIIFTSILFFLVKKSKN